MPTKKANQGRSTDKSEQMLTVLQDLFILQALDAGMKVNDIRRILKVDMWRVSNISKLIKPDKSKGGRKPGTQAPLRE